MSEIQLECILDGNILIGRMIQSVKQSVMSGISVDLSDYGGYGDSQDGTGSLYYPCAVDYTMGSIKDGGIIENSGVFRVGKTLLGSENGYVLPNTEAYANQCLISPIYKTNNYLKLYGNNDS